MKVENDINYNTYLFKNKGKPASKDYNIFYNKNTSFLNFDEKYNLPPMIANDSFNDFQNFRNSSQELFSSLKNFTTVEHSKMTENILPPLPNLSTDMPSKLTSTPMSDLRHLAFPTFTCTATDMLSYKSKDSNYKKNESGFVFTDDGHQTFGNNPNYNSTSYASDVNYSRGGTNANAYYSSSVIENTPNIYDTYMSSSNNQW